MSKNDQAENPPEEARQQLEELQEIFPFFRSWRQIYAFVLIELGVLIVLFYLFSRMYA